MDSKEQKEATTLKGCILIQFLHPIRQFIHGCLASGIYHSYFSSQLIFIPLHELTVPMITHIDMRNKKPYILKLL